MRGIRRAGARDDALAGFLKKAPENSPILVPTKAITHKVKAEL